MNQLTAIFQSMRPRQWTKNLLLFAGVIFARKLGDQGCVLHAFWGACVFVCSSSTVYVFNDIADIEFDRLHPYKRLRPIAAGRLSVRQARLMASGLLGLSLMTAWLLGLLFFAGVVLFLVWNWLYTRWFKNVPVLDVIGIGMSFVLRASAGVLVLRPLCPGVGMSAWLLLCTFFLSLFLGFCKRRDELLKLKPLAGSTRLALRGYTEPMVNALIGISFGLTMTSYALYTVWPATVEQFATRDLVWTLPFVLAGMGRYLYLVYLEDKGGRPHEILLTDLLLQVFVAGWIATAIMIIGT